MLLTLSPPIGPELQPLRNLRIVDLSHSQKLIKIQNFGEAINLERINLEGFIQLKQIDPSIDFLRKLTVLNLKDCKNLVSVPNSILGINSLEYLNLSGCSKIYKIQYLDFFVVYIQLLDIARDAEHLKKLCISENPIHSQSTSSIIKRWFTWPLHLLYSPIHSKSTSSIVKRWSKWPLYLLYSRAHKNLVSCSLPSLPTSPSMHELDLNFCNLLQIPDAVGNLCCLERLNLRGNNFAKLPSLKEFSELYYLNRCKQLKYLPELPSRIDLQSQTYMLPWLIMKYRDNERFSRIIHFQLPRISCEGTLHYHEFFMDSTNCSGVHEPSFPLLSLSLSLSSSCVCRNQELTYSVVWYQAEHRYKCLERVTVCSNIQSIIAGSQIPRWFNNQHVGRRSLTSREATPLLQDFNICIGFACCAVFVLRDEMDTIEMDLLKVELYTVDISGFLEGDLIMNESDNMWLCYITRSRFLGLCRLHMLPYNDKLKLNFFIKNKRGFPIVVKKHGYRWVYEEDL